jgi:hypothetical protein
MSKINRAKLKSCRDIQVGGDVREDFRMPVNVGADINPERFQLALKLADALQGIVELTR